MEAHGASWNFCARCYKIIFACSLTSSLLYICMYIENLCRDSINRPIRSNFRSFDHLPVHNLLAIILEHKIFRLITLQLDWVVIFDGKVFANTPINNMFSHLMGTLNYICRSSSVAFVRHNSF
jgi:hypothetical protein